jgi:transposase
VLGQFRAERPLNQGPLELLERPIISRQVLRLLIVSKQLIQQFGCNRRIGRHVSLLFRVNSQKPTYTFFLTLFGLSTKIHMAVRGLGCPVRFTLTAGQKGDAPQASALIEGLPAEVVMADTAYDADHLRQAIAAKGALAPQQPVTGAQISARQASHAQRHLVECCFSKLKQFRRVATRFEKTARNYLAVVTLAAIVLWMR